MAFRTKLRNILDNPKTREFFVVNDVLAALTLLSVISIILETVAGFEHLAPLFTGIEYVTVVAFTLEYIARIYISKKPAHYVLSFLGIIDLLAIVPTYLGVANLTYLKSTRILRILRFLRILRLTKFSRTSFFYDVSPVTLNVMIYVTALLSAVTIFGSLIYIAEPGNASFANIPYGMLWAAKALLGGLGGSVESQIPLTQLGQMIGLVARFTGLLLIGLLVSVVGNIFRLLLTGTSRV